jgi:ABC-type transport system substrate-binding protein
MNDNKLTRRQLLRLSALAGAGAVVAACGAAPTAAPQAEATKAEAPAAEPTKAEAEVAPTEAPAEEPTAAPEPAPAEAAVGDVPREKTLALGWGADQVGLMNPWTAGYTHQDGTAMLWEPLFYFQIFADKELPWIAESGEYNAEFTELTIKLRKQAKWSDGTPITSKDVKFTLDSQAKNDKLNYHGAVMQFVAETVAVDDQTVVVKMKEPAPRFKFEVLTLKFDTGIPMVPAHVLEAEADVTAFKGADVGGDGTVTKSMPHSGAYEIKTWTKDQKIMDLRADWWAIEAGLAAKPAVERVIMVNIPADMGTVAQRVVNNELDSALDFRNDIISNILKQNDKVTTHTGQNEPHGYLDWWPNSLWMNTQIAPFDDVKVRRAVNRAIDRDTINEVVYNGASVASIYPFPLYPGLQKFADSAEVKAAEEKLQPRKFDLAESEALMTEAGFAKNGDGLWEKDGATVPAVINGFEGIHADIVPVLVEMLKAGGFDSSINFGPDGYQNMADGKPGFYMFGHGASLLDPYAAFELFHSRFSAVMGTSAGNNRFSRYKNEEFDKLLDEIAPLPASDPKFQENTAKLMEIYWTEVIDVPIIQWLHRIAYNQTRWVNWPTTENLGPGCNGAFWAHTGHLVVTNLKPAA